MFGWPFTLAGLAGAAALLGLSVWQSERPKKDSLRPRWVPWKFLIFLSAAFILYLGVHAYMLAQGG